MHLCYNRIWKLAGFVYSQHGFNYPNNVPRGISERQNNDTVARTLHAMAMLMLRAALLKAARAVHLH